ncbi:MAG: GNAT family N-acetyltransferase [Mycobacteriaceae bacterium]
MLRVMGVRHLAERDVASVLRALNKDVIANCMVLARVEALGVARNRLGAELWTNDRPAQSLCFSGANLIPLHGDPQAIRAFAERAASQPRVCSSLVGAAELVLPMWEILSEHWGPAREVRARQPLLVLPGHPKVTPDPLVRRVRSNELDRYLSAAVAMFTEEIGIDPSEPDRGRSYRRRVQEIIAEGRAFARFEDGEVVFKAEVGARAAQVSQIQGVWVHPERRGQGLGTRGTAAVAALIQATGQHPTLYVNDFNTAARRAYDRVGFVQVRVFATVLLH